MQAETSVAETVTGDDTVRSPVATAPIPGLVWAFRIHSDGSSVSLAVDKPIEFAHDGLLWLHFNLADARALQWLASADLQAPVQARSLLLSKDTYQQLHATDDSVYGVISDLLRDIAEVTEETGYLRFAMTERLLVSGRHHALCAVDATRRALEDGHRIESVAALLEQSSKMSLIRWIVSPSALRDRLMRSRNRCCRTRQSICARDWAGCVVRACACTGNYRDCGLCFIVSSRRT